MNAAVEGEQMVLAHRSERDIAERNNLSGEAFDRRERSEMDERILVPPPKQLPPSGRRAGGRLDQVRAVGILAQGDEQLADGGTNPVGIHQAACWPGARAERSNERPARDPGHCQLALPERQPPWYSVRAVTAYGTGLTTTRTSRCLWGWTLVFLVFGFSPHSTLSSVPTSTFGSTVASDSPRRSFAL